MTALRDPRSATVAVIGLGYVGLPLAVELGKVVDVIGYDIKPERIAELQRGEDHTLEVTSEELSAATRLTVTDDAADLDHANVFIVTTPTPIDSARRPDLSPLLSASRTVGEHLSPGDVVIYESTVYPGATEEECVPVLESVSGLRFNEDFFVGYSPERINPGDKERRVTNIVKVTSGSTPETADFVDELYRLVVTAGTHRASSIKVAEAAKVIENTQRDVNIALINELAILFERLGIDTEEVLEAAGSKWNFLPFRPGLVGGHCIGVDPYYLTSKAEEVGYYPEVILAGRRINDTMGAFVAQKLVKMLAGQDKALGKSRVGVLGLTFKENVPDLRNSRVPDIIEELRGYGIEPLVHDARADAEEAEREYGLRVSPLDDFTDLDALVLAVPHEEYLTLLKDPLRFVRRDGIVIDVKSALRHDTNLVGDAAPVRYWSL